MTSTNVVPVLNGKCPTSASLFSALKRVIFFSISFFLPIVSYAQEYTINFVGSGASTVIDKVLVQNLTKNTQIELDAGMQLRLKTMITGIPSEINRPSSLIQTYPDISSGRTLLNFNVPVNGQYYISVYNSLGNQVATQLINLQEGIHEFELVIPQGIYLLYINNDLFNITLKFTSQYRWNSSPSIHYIGYTFNPSDPTRSEVQLSNNVVELAYSIGDVLLYTGISGNYKTLISDIPSESKTITFEFVECKDAAGKNYSVTKIGKQIWMAENLDYLPTQVSDQNDGLEDESNWESKNTPYYYLLDRDQYGVLYNWYAAQQSIPSGWHLPSAEEWQSLIDLLGGSYTAIPKIMSTKGWSVVPSAVTNLSCFTALPGGRRRPDLTTNDVYNGQGAFWISSSVINDVYFKAIELKSQRSGSSLILRNDNFYSAYSVRCLKNNTSVNYSEPLRLSLVEGNNQTGKPNTVLNYPIKLQLLDAENEPLSSRAVHFFDYQLMSEIFIGYTDQNGFVTMYWKLGSQTGNYTLEAYLKNDAGSPVESTRVQITANCTPALPIVVTADISNRENTKAFAGGEVYSDGGAFVTARGVCWSSITTTPTINDSSTFDGVGTGSFTSILTDLTTCTHYFYRAYAINAAGVKYGETKSFVGSYDLLVQPSNPAPISADGDTIPFTISINSTNNEEITWDITYLPSWIKAEKDFANNVLLLKVQPNRYPETREETILISSALTCSLTDIVYKQVSLKITQDPAEIHFEVSPTNVSFEAIDDSIHFINIYCNTPWRISVPPADWCTAYTYKTEDIEKDGLKVSVVDNPDYTERQCGIALEAKDANDNPIVKTVWVTQAPSTHRWHIDIVINQTEIYSSDVYLSGYPDGGQARVPGFRFTEMWWGKTGWDDFIMGIEFKEPSTDANRCMTFISSLPKKNGETVTGTISLSGDCALGSCGCGIPNWSGTYTLTKLE